MIHSGSRNVGKYIGGMWRDRACEAWPKTLKYPESRLFPLSVAAKPELVSSYLQAEATAANCGFINRLLLAELLRLRLRQVFGDVEAPLVYDVPHNITLAEGAGWVARKGACPAHSDQPVIVPGSMGAPSYLLVGKGNDRFLRSASDGAGRARSRFDMSRKGVDKTDSALGLTDVDCITLREECRIEEAPTAYINSGNSGMIGSGDWGKGELLTLTLSFPSNRKQYYKPIQPVIDVQVKAQIVGAVAKMKRVLTFKA